MDKNMPTVEGQREGIPEGWLTTGQALDYIWKSQGVQVSREGWYQRLHRIKEKGILDYRVVGKKYYFDPGSIDRVNFNPPRKVHLPKDFEPVKVDSAQDLADLARIYGALLDEDAFVAEISRRTGHTYKLGAIRQRLRRKSIYYVGYSGEKRRIRWFPANQIDKMSLQPPKKIESLIIADSAIQ